MGEILTVIPRWVHIASMAMLVGGILYARLVMIPAARSLSPDAQTALGESAAAHFRPVVFAAIVGLVLSGFLNYVSKPGHSIRYQGLFGLKLLLALHVFSVALQAAGPKNPRRARQLFGAAISGLAILLISAYLRGIA
jgi:uncharacterized membrane protein